MQIIEKRKIFYIISLIIIIPGIISLFMQGLNLGIDFQGGSLLHLSMDSSADAPAIRATLAELELEKGIEVQQSGNEYYVRTPELNQEQTKKVVDALQAKFEHAELLKAASVGAIIGSELTRNAVLSLLAATILMLIYITIRFELSFGIASIVGIIHNVLIVLGLFSIFQWEVNTPFIAALLTVIGYSINDTIVVFDRIRENLRMKKKESYAILCNKSVMQTINRSINTVITSAFPLTALFFLGGESIKLLVLAMLIGFISGAYSSIFIASPVWYEMKNKA